MVIHVMAQLMHVQLDLQHQRPASGQHKPNWVLSTHAVQLWILRLHHGLSNTCKPELPLMLCLWMHAFICAQWWKFSRLSRRCVWLTPQALQCVCENNWIWLPLEIMTFTRTVAATQCSSAKWSSGTAKWFEVSRLKQRQQCIPPRISQEQAFRQVDHECGV